MFFVVDGCPTARRSRRIVSVRKARDFFQLSSIGFVGGDVNSPLVHIWLVKSSSFEVPGAQR